MAVTTGTSDDGPEGNDGTPDNLTQGVVENSSVYVSGGTLIQGNINLNSFEEGAKTERSAKPQSLAEQRQELYFDLLRGQQTDYFDSWSQDRKHANAAFWAAVALLLISGLLLLAGGAIAMIQNDLQPLTTASLPGVPFAAVGAGLALYARKAKADANARADRVEEQIIKSHKLQTVLTLVDEFEDAEKRDNMRTTVIMKTMGLQPNPETVVDRLLPEGSVRPREEIEPGGSKT